MKYLSVLVVLCLMGSFAAGRDITVVHFGDSNTITSYLDKSDLVNAVLQDLLTRHYKGQKITCVNAGQGGDYIRRFLDKGRYDKHVKSKYKNVDIACIRYGQNDMKHYKPEEFQAHLIDFIGVLRADYPGIHIFLETGIYIDGKHWSDQTKDASKYCNEKYDTYWAITRKVAAEMNLPLVDQFKRWDTETKAGLWDLRIRNSKCKDDPSDPAHYYNAHANRVGVQLYAMELFRHISGYFPGLLPRAGMPPADTVNNKIPPAKAAYQAVIQKEVDNAAQCLKFAVEKLESRPSGKESLNQYLIRAEKGLKKALTSKMKRCFRALKRDKRKTKLMVSTKEELQVKKIGEDRFRVFIPGRVESSEITIEKTE